MKFPLFTLAGAVCLASGCVSKRDIQPPTEATAMPVALNLAFQSNRLGAMEPCGCQSKPYGGIDRQANALEELSKTGELLYVDAGNLLAKDPATAAPGERKQTPAQARSKAIALWKAEREMKLSVFAPGPADYALGTEFLQALAVAPDSPLMVSTNVVDAKGSPLFAPYQIRKISGVRIAFLSASPELDGVSSIPADVALRHWLPEASRGADVVVVLSQLGAKEDERILETYPSIHLVIGSDPKIALQRPLWFPGGRLLVDPASEGTFLGNLSIKVNLPFQGFSSDAVVAEAHRKLAYWKGREDEPSTATLAKREIKRLQLQEPSAAIQGGSDYLYELIGLDAEHFGKANSLTRLRSDEKDRVRREALAE